MGITAAIYPVTAIPSRLALENRNWVQAANLELQEIELNWEKFPWQEAILHFAKSLGASQTKDFEKAEQEIEILKVLHQNLVAQNDRTKAIQVKQVEIQIKTSQAWLNFKQNDLKKGLALMREAVEIEKVTSKHPITPGDILPAIELLGDMFLELNKPEEALAAYEQNLIDRPNRFNGIYGAAIAAKQSGNLEKAASYFEDLLKLTANTVIERQEINEAKAFLKTNVI